MFYLDCLFRISSAHNACLLTGKFIDNFEDSLIMAGASTSDLGWGRKLRKKIRGPSTGKKLRGTLQVKKRIYTGHLQDIKIGLSLPREKIDHIFNNPRSGKNLHRRGSWE